MRWCAIAALLVAGLTPPPVAAPLQAQPLRGTIVEIPMRAANSHPFGLAVDPSGNVWYTQWSTGIVGVLDPSSGREQTYFIPTTNAEPAGLAVDGNGDVWVAEHGSDRIARLRAPDYRYDYYDVPTVGSEPYSVAVDPQGIVWFTAFASNELGRLDPATRQVRTYRVPTPDSHPAGLAIGRDGMVYFAQWAGNNLARFDPATGDFKEWPLPDADSYVYEVALGPDGRLWFAEHGGNHVGRLDPATGAVERFELPTQDANPYGVSFDQAGYLWFSEWTGNKIGRLDPANGSIQEFLVPTASAQPGRLLVDPSATVWFVQWNGNKIGQLATLQAVAWAPAVFKASEGRDSGLQIQNVGTGPATVSVRYYDAQGSLLYTDAAVVLPVGGSVTHYVPSKPVPAGGASATVLSDGKVVAIVNETRHTAAGFAAAAYDVPRRLATVTGLPIVQRARAGWTTSFAVHNPTLAATRVVLRPAPLGSAGSAGVTLSATSFVSGTAGVTSTVATTGTAALVETLPPGGMRLFDAAALAALGSDFTGSAVLFSDVPVAVVAWLSRDGEGGPQLSAYTGVVEGAPGVSAPLLFRDYNGWNTDLAVQNLGDQAARVSVTYYDRNGAPLTAAAESAAIQPGSAVQFRQAANPSLPAGWVGSALISNASPAPLAVVVAETNPGRGLAMAYNGLNLLDLTPRASAPLVMKDYNGWNTGVQVQNLSDGPATVTITYFDRDTGAPVGGAIETQTVQPGTAYTFYQAAATALPSGFVGSAVVTASGRIAVVVNGVNDRQPGDSAISYNGANY